MGHALRLTDRNFDEEVLAADGPVLVDFWSSWCPPCKMTEPVIEAIAEEREATLKVGKLQVDQNPLMSSRYEVLGVPTFVLFRDGEILARRTGALAKRQLLKMVDDALASE
ncbi:MAG: thioredoxin [Anaerolineae bacterium]